MPGVAEGIADSRFAEVRERFERALSGAEVGAAVALMVDGKLLVNLWGGFKDRARTRPWREDTLCCVFSTTKGLTALCALLAAASGHLDLNSPVADYWPAFGANGKDSILVRDLLDHRAGVVGFHEPFDRALFYDWNAVTARLEGERPWWQPGTEHGYHARTFGFLVGEVLRRTTGESVGALLTRHVAGPLGVELPIGLDERLSSRCADIVPARIRAGVDAGVVPERREFIREMNDPGTPTGAAFSNPSLGAGYMNSAQFRSAELPAMNAHTTAAALATVYGRLVRPRGPAGTAVQVGLLPDEWLTRATLTSSFGVDRVLKTVTRFGLGFLLNHETMPLGPSPAIFGHSGAGGSIAFGDPDAGIGFAYVMNQLRPGVVGANEVALDLIDAVYRDLK